MKYILFILALILAVNAKAQSDLQRTPKGASYRLFTHNTGDRIKLNDIVTFQFIQKTDKDSVLASTYTAGHPVQAQIVPSEKVGDLMEIFPLLTIKDSAMVVVPTDSIFKGNEDKRPAFFPKGSKLTYILKIEKVQSLTDFIADIKAAETKGSAKYITDHKLVLKATPSGLRYVITKPSLKRKPLKGDTVLVNYTGRTVDDKVFDSSIEADAKAAGLQQPGRTYEPLQVVVGTSSVIPGWDEGLLLLNEGSKATFIIPSSLAYGEQGQGEIRPFSTLVFDIELVKVKPTKHAATPKPPLKKIMVKKKTVAKKTAIN
ncbi:MAG: FKBP-type peptidyl-prolyl cis-trans isomerase FkpA [Mucilaginibacter sp.]|nr:FKBP-type peptidyl-prolyl cis-trans isomerase FkpA [Mucilaginibacter sp.]